MCSASCAKILLIVFNLIFWLGGAALLGIGIWMKVDPTIINYLDIVNISQGDPLISYAAWMFIVIGGVAFLVGFLGCCGALKSSQSLLFLYCILVAIIMLAEITAAILALVYRGKIEDHLEMTMTNQLKNDYVPGSSTQQAWDFLQQDLQCCGAQNYTDYRDSNWWNNTRNATQYVPNSCCNSAEGSDPMNPKFIDIKQCQELASKPHTVKGGFLYLDGCYDSIISWFQNHSLIMMILGFAIGACQVFGLVTACLLRKALKGDKYAA